MGLLFRWVAAAAGVAAAVYLVEGIRMEGSTGSYFGVALILGFVNALVRPVLKWLSCGLIFLTLGLFLLVINAGMLILTEGLAQAIGFRFTIDDFTSALLGAIVISLVSYFASLLVGGDD